MTGDPFLRYSEDGKRYVTRLPGDFRCDFCLVLVDLDEVWTYEADPMPIVGPRGRVIQATDDDWAVCPDCHRLIDARMFGALIERAVTMQPINDGGPDRLYGPLPLRRRWMGTNVERFRRAREGHRPPRQGPW